MLDMDIKQKDLCNATGWTKATISILLNNRTEKPSLKILLELCNGNCKKSCVYKENFFPDMNQICKNLLSDSVIFMLSNFLYSHSITSSYVYIHLFSFFCIPIRH